jgi:hypothetical protein
MHKTLLAGVAAALFATAMSGTAAAAYGPSTPCTAANDGEIQTVDYWSPRTGSYSRVFQCDTGAWQLIAYCDQYGCVYY